MPELPSINADAKPVTADDIFDSFADLDAGSDKIPLREEKPDKEDKADKADKSDEIELVEPEDGKTEKLDLEDDSDDSKLEIDAPPRKKEILKKYPDVFKEFPFLEKMMYRDKAYTELFGSFDDAKEVAEKADHFDHVESTLMSGSTEELLKGVKDNDERAFNLIVDDYLPTLLKVDKDAYFHVIGNLNKRLIMEMWKEGTDTSNDTLKEAAIAINQFVFGSSKFEAPKARVDRTQDPKKDEVEQERLQFVQERFENSRDELQTQVDNTLKATISEYIDPKGKMSAYVKKNAVNDAMRLLTSSIAEDGSVSKNLDKLWRTAFDSKFSKESLNRIKSFYLGKAKGGLRNAILKARAEALKDLSPAAPERNEDEGDERPVRRTNPIPGRPSQPIKRGEMRKGESVQDFFSRD